MSQIILAPCNLLLVVSLTYVNSSMFQNLNANVNFQISEKTKDRMKPTEKTTKSITALQIHHKDKNDPARHLIKKTSVVPGKREPEIQSSQKNVKNSLRVKQDLFPKKTNFADHSIARCSVINQEKTPRNQCKITSVDRLPEHEAFSAIKKLGSINITPVSSQLKKSDNQIKQPTGNMAEDVICIESDDE